MKFAKTYSVTFVGLKGVPVEIEVDIKEGEESFTIVGLPDTAVKESKERVRAALKNSHLPLKACQITLNLAPGDVRKEGTLYDLPIALSLLAASGHFQATLLARYLIVGELSLSGELRPIQGALGAALLASKLKLAGIILPASNQDEAVYISDIEVRGVSNLPEIVSFFKHPTTYTAPIVRPVKELSSKISLDFSHVRGQAHAKRALEIAAAGEHNVLLSGPPGTGKSMLAKAFQGILPPLSLKEMLEITHIHSFSKVKESGLVTERPFRAPHNTISYVGMIGGGRIPKPGEVCLAHRGVLFLDELPEFSRQTLEVLRQPLEDKKVTVSRAQGYCTFPTDFICIAAMNPCPCGFLGHPKKNCQDTPLQIERYQKKISGPLLDRIDMHISVSTLTYEKMIGEADGESSQTIQKRVIRARERQYQRAKKSNGQMGKSEIQEVIRQLQGKLTALEQAVDRMHLSARACDRILKVTRTLADLEGVEKVTEEHLLEALSYRMLF